MPTYSYRCSKCEQTFDAFHSMSCKDAQHCPECGGEGTKLLSASSVIFKGSGFYSTDYRDSGYLEAKKRDSNGSDQPAETKKETAPTAATDSASKPASESKPDSTSSPTTPAPQKPTSPAQAA